MAPSQVFAVLADPTRLRILERLEKSRALSVGEIASFLRLKEPSVSQHLKTLRGAGLLSHERHGRHVYYRLDQSARRTIAEAVGKLPGARRSRSRLSARNRLLGRVTSIERDQITAAVTLDVGGQTVTSVITSAALDELALEVGDTAYAVVKATEVMLMK